MEDNLASLLIATSQENIKTTEVTDPLVKNSKLALSLCLISVLQLGGG